MIAVLPFDPRTGVSTIQLMQSFVPAGVLFDMDGLLLDTERIAKRAWQLGGEPLGLQMPDAVYSKLIGRRLTDIDRILREEMGHDFPLQEWFAYADKHYKRMTLQEPLPLKDGVHELLSFLKQSAIPAIVATSTTTDLAILKLQRVRILSYFVGVVGGDQVAHGKPAPDIYLRAAELLQLPAAACLVLEDSEPGIEAGYRAGAKAVMVPDLVQPGAETLERAHAIHQDLHSVTNWLSTALAKQSANRTVDS